MMVPCLLTQRSRDPCPEGVGIVMSGGRRRTTGWRSICSQSCPELALEHVQRPASGGISISFVSSPRPSSTVPTVFLVFERLGSGGLPMHRNS